MVYYKITSLTHKLPKRHINKDKTLEIEYRESFSEKKYILPPNGTLYISSPSLPVNLHKLRMKKMITVVEINKNTFMRLQQPPIPVVQPKVEKTTTTEKPVTKRGRKKTIEVEKE